MTQKHLTTYLGWDISWYGWSFPTSSYERIGRVEAISNSINKGGEVKHIWVNAYVAGEMFCIGGEDRATMNAVTMLLPKIKQAIWDADPLRAVCAWQKGE